MTYEWTIPANQFADTNSKYFFTATNISDPTGPFVIASSQAFLILPEAADLSSSSSSFSSTTTAKKPSSTSALTIASSTTSSVLTSQRGMPAGGKIALGVSVPIGGIVLGLIGLWAWRRRLRADSKQCSTQGPDSSSEKPPAEIGGGDIVEADNGDYGHHPDSSHGVQLQGVHELDGNNIAGLLATR